MKNKISGCFLMLYIPFKNIIGLPVHSVLSVRGGHIWIGKLLPPSE